ncbi:MAG: SPOR domain-containing protein [Magnetospirillum sp. WYHS-4]
MRDGLTKRLVVLAALLAAACGQLPQPFLGPSDPKVSPLAAIKEAGNIEVEHVDGPAVPMARLLAQSVADELSNRGIPASAGGPGTGHYLLKSKTRTNQDSSAATIVFIEWTLFDKQRRPMGSHVQEVKGTWWEWVNGDPKIIRAVGLDTGKAVAAMLQDPREVAATQPGARKGVRVQEVVGAPGDGNQTLAAALKTALKDADVPVADKAGDLLATINGTVEMSPPDKKGQQTVRITWTVLRPDGSTVGEAQQENAVPAGSLDGPWGRVSGLAATAATDGIKQILAKVEDEAVAGRPQSVATAPVPEAVPMSPPADPAKAPQIETSAKPAPEAKPNRATSPAAAMPARMAAVHSGGGPRIQLASLRSPDQAAKEWKKLQESYPAVLAGLNFHVEEADLGPRGLFYRVQAGPFASRAEAVASCDALQKLSVACIVAGR